MYMHTFKCYVSYVCVLFQHSMCRGFVRPCTLLSFQYEIQFTSKIEIKTNAELLNSTDCKIGITCTHRTCI